MLPTHLPITVKGFLSDVLIISDVEAVYMDELLRKLRDKTITREKLLKLKEMLEKRIKEFEERGKCEKAQA